MCHTRRRQRWLSSVSLGVSARNKMTNVQRASELKQLRAQVRAGALRTDLRTRRDILGRIVPLMSFYEIYHSNALQFADRLSQEGVSSSMYDSCGCRLDVLIGEAVTE